MFVGSTLEEHAYRFLNIKRNTVGAKEILTLLKRRKKITAKQGIKIHIPLSLLSVGRV